MDDLFIPEWLNRTVASRSVEVYMFSEEQVIMSKYINQGENLLMNHGTQLQEEARKVIAVSVVNW